MVIIEALVLLTTGLVLGIVSTVFDVLVMGTASFLSHFSLWVLLNALMAVHVDSRVKAIWWAIPFNLGFIEGYFITTVASFESYPKSLMVPLAAIALIAPFLTYAIWTAKREKNAYGQFLSIVIVVCTLVAGYIVNKHVGIYDIVVCALLAYVLLAMPVKRLKITRATRTVTTPDGEVIPEPEVKPESTRAPRKRPKRLKKRQPTPKPTRQPTRRKRTKPEPAQEEERRQPTRQPRPTRRRKRRVVEEQEPTMQTLGNARAARRSSRNA